MQLMEVKTRSVRGKRIIRRFKEEWKSEENKYSGALIQNLNVYARTERNVLSTNLLALRVSRQEH